MGERDRIVSYARANIGASYSTIPSGGEEGVCYNCSFLTKCAYAAAGLDIPGWQGHQNGNGSQSDWVRWAGNWKTDPDDLQPGDLVFFGYYDEDEDEYITGHVGISLGGWDMIDSIPNGGVQERTLYDNFVGGGWPFEGAPGGEVWRMIPAKGTVRFKYGMVVRDYPSTIDGNKIGDGIAYEAGETCNIDGIILNDGRVWGHYIGASSKKDRYVALTDEALAFAEAVD